MMYLAGLLKAARVRLRLASASRAASKFFSSITILSKQGHLKYFYLQGRTYIGGGDGGGVYTNKNKKSLKKVNPRTLYLFFSYHKVCYF